MLHSFAPPGIHGANARTTQMNMVNHVANGLGGGNVFFAQNTIDYGGQGFVFGRRKAGGNWKFYAYGSTTGVRRLCDV